MSASIIVRGVRRQEFPDPPAEATRLLDGRPHLARVAIGQAGEVDYLTT